MKTSKRVLSLLLTIVMILSIVPLATVQSSAASITKGQAVTWANAQIGKSLDQDGVYGAQCVDLIRYYYSYLGVSPVSGNGCDYATNALPTGWTRIQYYNGFVPQPGDIAVWTYASSAYGHVAIVTSADSSKMNVVEQNGSTHITRAHSYSYSFGTFYGVIRPTFEAENQEAPDAPMVWLDKNVIAPDEQIRINFWSERAARYWIGIYQNGNLIHDAYTEYGYYDISFTTPGDYNVTISADNAYGYTASYTSFTVKPLNELVPDAPTVQVEKTNLLPNEQIRINFWSERAEKYWIGIYKDGNLIYDTYTYLGYYDVSFSDIGNYNIVISADNSYGYNASYVYFTVTNPPATVSSISIQSKPTKTVYTVGEKFDASGLTVNVTMSDGTTKTITSGFTLSNPDMSTAGTKTVTVTYSGKTTSFTITVQNAEMPANAGALRLRTPTSARVGQTVQIPVHLDKVSLGTLTFTVRYDHTKLKYVSCTEPKFGMCDVNTKNIDEIKLACIDSNAVSAGDIAVLTFEVIAPSACTTELTLTVEEAYDSGDKAVSVTGGTWSLSIVKTLLGDVNGDGKVTAIDARWVLQVASGSRVLTDEQKAVADVNGDGRITAINARWILQVASGSRVL